LTSYAPRQQPVTVPGQPTPARPARRLPERATDNGTAPASAYDRRVPADQLLPDLALYEQLIDQGTAVADAQDSPVDHVTARRLAIWLATRPQQPTFAQGLARFINTGAIQRDLKNQFRLHARSASHADHAQAARLLRYCVDRDTDPCPVGASFGAACHQMDRSDLMLAETRDRTWHGTGRRAEQAEQEIGRPRVTALAHHDPESQTVTFVLDAVTANIAVYAITAHAQEREAHLREIQLHAQDLPEGSYGRRNRQAIADRETRITTRLRAIQQAYQAAIEHDIEPTAPEPPAPLRLAERAADIERDLEIGQ
jgi:hypothetical protein